MPSLTVSKALVQSILLRAEEFPWTLQGLGMLRLYLGGDEVRLHVWDGRYAEPEASRIHNHPWDFMSEIIAGELANQRYVPEPENAPWPTGDEYQRVKILCGIGGGAVSDVDTVRLRAQATEIYRAGDTYQQWAHELHDTRPLDGTVSIITRRFGADVDHAQVCWSKGPWVSVEPRPATTQEINTITTFALERWF